MRSEMIRARLRRSLGVVERALLGAAMSLIVLIVERQLSRQIARGRAANSSPEATGGKEQGAD